MWLETADPPPIIQNPEDLMLLYVIPLPWCSTFWWWWQIINSVTWPFLGRMHGCLMSSGRLARLIQLLFFPSPHVFLWLASGGMRVNLWGEAVDTNIPVSGLLIVRLLFLCVFLHVFPSEKTLGGHGVACNPGFLLQKPREFCEWRIAYFICPPCLSSLVGFCSLRCSNAEENRKTFWDLDHHSVGSLANSQFFFGTHSKPGRSYQTYSLEFSWPSPCSV